MNCGIWNMGLLSTVVSGPLFNLECVFSLIYSLKFKMTLKPKLEVKSDPGLTPFTFLAGPTKMPLQYNKLVLPIEKHHQQTYIFALLIEEWFAWYLIFDIFDHWCFPFTCCLTGLNCYNVTSGSVICNNVTSSCVMQVCKHDFTNLVLNVMTKLYFDHVITSVFIFKLSFTWHVKFLNDLHWFLITFPGKKQFSRPT